MDRWLLRVVVGSVLVLLASPAVAFADTTVDFEQFAPGTTITNQYADLGGPGQGVTFGPLPGGAAGFNPVITTLPAGQTTQSGTQAGDIHECFGCEFFTPLTTGTFAVARSQVSVYAGVVDQPSAPCTGSQTDPNCTFVTLEAFDAAGTQVAATPPTLVSDGTGVHTLLSVSTSSATIVGFEVTARQDVDDNKSLTIDDLSFNTPTTPPTPDFSLTPSVNNVNLVTGSSSTIPISIGRFGGSSGSIDLAVSGTLPTGVTATISPNPAAGTASTLTLSADGSAPPTTGTNPTITVTGTPESAATGTAPRSFPVTVGVQRAFDVSVPEPTSFSLSSCSVNVPVEVIRNLNFPGPVSLSVTGLPAAVSSSFSSPQATFPNGSGAQDIALTLTAPESGGTLLPKTVTIHASAPPLPERTATFTVAGSCPLHYDPEVVSMQITQGTQLPVLPHRDPNNPAAPIAYRSLGQSALAGSEEALAGLAAFKPTVVRVYADLKYGPTSGITVPAVLKGFSSDQSGNLVPLPGSPILPVATPGPLTPGLGAFGDSFIQNNNVGVYTFTLPSSWEQKTIQLEADLMPSQSTGIPVAKAPFAAHPAAVPGQPPAWAPCTTSDCQIDGKFALSKIPFLYTFPFEVRPVAMIRTNPYDSTLPDPLSTFAWAGVVTPIPLIIDPYAATIDIGDQIGKPNSNGDVTMELLNRMVNYLCNHGEPSHGADVGIQHDGIRSAQAVGNVCWQDLGLDTHSFAFVNAPQPLTSVTHELFHLLGLPHASPGCGAAIGLGGSGTQAAEDWAPDEQGFLQSIGLALPPAGSSDPPFKIIQTPDQGAQAFDLMSYCSFVSAGDPLGTNQNAWVSVHNWNHILSEFGFASPTAARRAAAASARAATTPAHAARAVSALQVTASVDRTGHVTIADVDPVRAAPKSASSSPYHLVATGARGQPRLNVPMISSFGHMDGRPPQPLLMLNAVIPASGVAGIGVSSSGKVVAARKRSAHAPRVSISRLPSVRRGFALVHWRATDRDHDPLAIEIDYSGNNGRSYNPVWMGPNRGQAKLFARYLFRSSRARIRVLAHDGFRTTIAVSRRFRSPGTAPAVQILTPSGHLRQPNSAPLVLTGQAFDDRSRQLTGKRLRWMLGRRLLGTGARITVSGLPAGRQRLRLIARDAFGRRSTASVVVQMRATLPLFLKLQAPRTLGHNARTLPLTVSSSVAATLVVRIAGRKAQRFTVGRRTRRLKIKVARGKSTLTLQLSLQAGGPSRPAVVTVPRP